LKRILLSTDGARKDVRKRALPEREAGISGLPQDCKRRDDVCDNNDASRAGPKAVILPDARAPRMFGHDMKRRELYFWGAAIAILNVMARYVVFAFDVYDPVGAVATTFNVSVIVWALFYWALSLLFAGTDEGADVDGRDVAIVAAATVIAAAPIEYVGWFAVMIVGAGAWLTAGGDRDQRKAGILLVSVTAPMFWTKMIFSVFSHYILTLDAMLVAALTQTERYGNLVAIPGGSGYLQILGPCSSFANISLSYLGWLMVLCYYDISCSLRLIVWCVGIILAIVGVNTIRISLIGFFPTQYELIHGAVGSTIVGWIYIVLIFGLAAKAVRREPGFVDRDQGPVGADSRQLSLP
jgi:hypothetical protein